MYDGFGHDLSHSPTIPTPHDAVPPLLGPEDWPTLETGAPSAASSGSEAAEEERRFEAELARLLERPASSAPTAASDALPTVGIGTPVGHRRRTSTTGKPARQPATGATALDRLSHTMVAATIVLVTTISLLGAAVTLEPLRHAAATERGTARWWPVLVHGPWIVACLSIVRSSLHYHRAVHAWIVAITFAGLSMALAVTDAPKNPHGIVTATLPAIAMTACLHQLVRQITLTRPPRRTNRSPRSRL
ncbi:hypothetical protein B4N89_37035 [Embleya scabrispora]|uniref:DUF2637 domain-containing protein n=1 Tax=Embleya scabrispora TaxID=159449 RepID=A0A1T3NMD1_9ACTN|nr:hypothetical protein [Embleya scabrispora]OPC77870.1 hypothetical protein B4N89_37035 [Embleya scabrispora]